MTKKELLRMIEAKEVELQEINEQLDDVQLTPSAELQMALEVKDHVINELHTFEVMLDREDYEDDPPDEEAEDEDDSDEPDHVLEDEECRR